MNYIQQLNAFKDWVMINRPSTGQIALWYSLMSINNMAGWTEWFTAPNQTLQLMSGLSRQGLEKARGQLIQKGLIEYKKGKSNQAGHYKIIPFYTSNYQKVGTEVVTGVGTEGALEEAQKGPDSSTLYKLNKTKLNETETTSTNPYRLFESEGFGTISSFIAENIQDMIDTYGEVWVCEAMREAVLQGKRKLSYVRGILKSWAADGMRRSNKEQKKPKSSIDHEIELQRRMRDRNEQPVDWLHAE